MIFSDDRKRKCANPPAMLRQRMLERSMDSEPETDQASDHDILLALHRMNESDRRAALQLLPTPNVSAYPR
jgi:hypothetical protein